MLLPPLYLFFGSFGIFVFLTEISHQPNVPVSSVQVETAGITYGAKIRELEECDLRSIVKSLSPIEDILIMYF